ncbi:Rv3654c family TadE-like protein [Brevibacterium yomogidense]|uniref:Rv3654c family TadE-like protein n=1 Tax=Brevibacterium yomogidense TaxID=946573 RepID=UPI0018E033AA
MDAERTVIGGSGAGGEGAAPPDEAVGPWNAGAGRLSEGVGRRDEGSSTVPAVGVAAVAVALALMVGTIGQGLGARSRADTAADLAALAAAQVAGDDGCGIAEEVAKRNGATVTECITRPDLGKATVTVEVPSGVRVPGKPDALKVSAKAVAGRAE